MRRYSDGTILYGPGDQVALNTGSGLKRGRVMLQTRDGYRVSVENRVIEVSAEQIVKEQDTGQVGFVQHMAEGRLI